MGRFSVPRTHGSCRGDKNPFGPHGCPAEERRDYRPMAYPTGSGKEGLLPDTALASRQRSAPREASGGGAVVSFELQEGTAARHVLRRVKLSLMAVSLGGVESILSYPAAMSHAAMPPAERAARGITDGLVRLSVGLEDPKDLCDDLAQAMEGI